MQTNPAAVQSCLIVFSLEKYMEHRWSQYRNLRNGVLNQCSPENETIAECLARGFRASRTLSDIAFERGEGDAARCEAAGPEKPEAYSLGYIEDFFGPSTTQMVADLSPQ